VNTKGTFKFAISILSSVFLQRNSFSIDLFFFRGSQNCQFWISTQINQILRASNAVPSGHCIYINFMRFFPSSLDNEYNYCLNPTTLIPSDLMSVFPFEKQPIIPSPLYFVLIPDGGRRVTYDTMVSVHSMTGLLQRKQRSFRFDRFSQVVTILPRDTSTLSQDFESIF